MDLADDSPVVRLKELFLSTNEAALSNLVGVLKARIEEGHGETVFEVGFENNGDSMTLSKEEWDNAIKRLILAAKKINCECQILLTRGVEGDAEGVVATGEHIKECSGKVLIRQHPTTVEDVIETR